MPLLIRSLLYTLFFSLLIGISSCKKPTQSLESKVQGDWQILAENKEMTDSISGVLKLNRSDQVLQFELTTSNPTKTLMGSWSVQATDSILSLVVEPQIDALTIDSLVLQKEGTEPILKLLQHRKEVGQIVNGRLSLKSKSLHYKILECRDGKLTLLGGEEQLQLIRTAETSYAMGNGFSISALFRGLLGMATLLFIAYLFSTNRRAISWSLVGKGLLLQLIFALGVLKVPFIETIFETVSQFFVVIISFTQEGIQFLFGSFETGEVHGALINFVVQVLPTIVFFSALTSIFYYLGWLQKLVYVFAWIMRRIMKLSGAESLAAAGNIFLGQTESPLLIKPYLLKMTRSEMLCLMSGGMATIAGSVLAAYIGFLGGSDPVEQLYFAKHLLAASVMSAPAAVVAAKILVPETEDFNQSIEVPRKTIGSNLLEAIANGTSDGLRLAVNVAAMLLVFTALIAMVNYILGDMIGAYTGANQWIVGHTNYEQLSFQFLMGYAFAPIVWLMGVSSEDMVLVGQLLGEKTILNEFYAYVSLGGMKSGALFSDQKSVVMATYMLCGFANFASIGIQIGGIGALVPSRKGLLSRLGLLALVGGTLASLFTAVLVGMIL